MTMKRVTKWVTWVGSIAGALIALGTIGSVINSKWDTAVMSHAEGDSKYLATNDFKISRTLDKIDAANKNIGQMKGLIAQHRLSILQGKDEGKVLEGEIIRLDLRIDEEVATIHKLQKYIACLDAEQEHCIRIIGVNEG
jgi:hypothetical protein